MYGIYNKIFIVKSKFSIYPKQSIIIVTNFFSTFQQERLSQISPRDLSIPHSLTPIYTGYFLLLKIIGTHGTGLLAMLVLLGHWLTLTLILEIYTVFMLMWHIDVIFN